MIYPAALFAWSLFLSILLLAVMSGALQPRPILFVSILGSGISALVALTLILTSAIGDMQ